MKSNRVQNKDADPAFDKHDDATRAMDVDAHFENSPRRDQQRE